MAFCPIHGDPDCNCPIEPDEDPETPEDQWREEVWELIGHGHRMLGIPLDRIAAYLEFLVGEIEDGKIVSVIGIDRKKSE